jgi:histidinol dehydrogenase
MIRTVDLRGRSLSKAQYNSELPRATLNVQDAMILIEPILERVKNGTEADLIALAQEFDGVRPTSIRSEERR